jgi:predicted DNA-binding protein YlxM (UPF0122 family)
MPIRIKTGKSQKTVINFFINIYQYLFIQKRKNILKKNYEARVSTSEYEEELPVSKKNAERNRQPG